MKKILVIVLAVLSMVSVFAQTIISTTVEVCNTRYQCYGSGNPAFEGTDLGNISELTFNGGMGISGIWSALTASMYYRIEGGEWMYVILDKRVVATEDPPEKSPSKNPEDPSEHDFVLAKTLSSTTSYSRYSDLSVSTSSLTNGNSYTLDIVHAVSGTTMPADTSTADYSASFTKIAAINFTDGSSYSPDQLTKGSTDQPFARFSLNADVTGATLTDIFIRLDGTRTGFSNIKFWSSSDATFDGSDSQIGATTTDDPGTSAEIKWIGLSEPIGTSVTYYFLTADVEGTATGSIQGVIVDGTKMTVSNGEITGTISSAALSGSEVPCPVTLTSFTAEAFQGKVELFWVTESETENSHFLVYRDGEVIGRVDGAGTTTEQHSYSYTDTQVRAGNHSYAIADVTWGGEVTEHAPVNVEVESGGVSVEEFVLNKAYPNPFNPTVVLSMEYGVGSNAVLNIYNTQGVLVDQLINGFVEAGSYDITWDATNMPSGVYIVKMVAGNVMQSQKIVLMK